MGSWIPTHSVRSSLLPESRSDPTRHLQ